MGAMMAFYEAIIHATFARWIEKTGVTGYS